MVYSVLYLEVRRAHHVPGAADQVRAEDHAEEEVGDLDA
jgi:hypothetical protein